jgi:hypothetical protein
MFKGTTLTKKGKPDKYRGSLLKFRASNQPNIKGTNSNRTPALPGDPRRRSRQDDPRPQRKACRQTDHTGTARCAR